MLRPFLWAFLPLLLGSAVAVSCTPAVDIAEDADSGSEPLARTEFTDRIENFFEYTPLVAGNPSEFLIHLTDLSDGSPVAQAEVDLTVMAAGSERAVVSVRALVGRVTGIYVAEVVVPEPGRYDIRFDVRSGDIDETMRPGDFEVN